MHVFTFFLSFGPLLKEVGNTELCGLKFNTCSSWRAYTLECALFLFVFPHTLLSLYRALALTSPTVVFVDSLSLICVYIHVYTHVCVYTHKYMRVYTCEYTQIGPRESGSA